MEGFSTHYIAFDKLNREEKKEKQVLEMDYNKNGFVDSEKEKEKPYNKIKLRYMGVLKAEILKDMIIRGMKAEKLKSMINAGMKAEKLKGMMVARSRLAWLKLWAVRATTMVLLWALAMQLRVIRGTLGPGMLKSRVAYSLPPESNFYTSFAIRKIKELIKYHYQVGLHILFGPFKILFYFLIIELSICLSIYIIYTHTHFEDIQKL